MSNRVFRQLIPIILTIALFLILVGLLNASIHLLNLFPTKEKIKLVLFPADIVVGLTIYIKTSIDFAILIGNLMHTYPGTKNRIAIELGTALGNGIGTLIILTLWTFFKEIPLLMALMILLASLVLFSMSEDSLKDFFNTHTPLPAPVWNLFHYIYSVLSNVNSFFSPIISLLLPHPASQKRAARSFGSLLLFSFSVPFILGLDDFAGYIPLFSIINVFGFAIGVLLGHMLLNISLFASPKATTKIVRLPVIMLVGAIAFIGIALWGFVEVFHILF